MNRLLKTITLEDPDGVEVTLEADGYRHLHRAEGLQGITVRRSVTPLPGRHGSRNRTRLRDDRVMIFAGEFTGEDSDRAWLEYHAVSRALAGAVDTDRLLRWTAGDDLALQALVRCDDVQAPIQRGATRIASLYALRASDPRAYSQTETTVAGGALSSSGGGGLTFPFTFPFTFDPTSGGVVGITNAGTVETPPLIDLTGYLLDPIVRLDDGREMVLEGEIGAGQTVTIDVANRTVTHGSGGNAIDLVNFAASTWFDLPVGTHTVTLIAGNFDASAAIEIRYRAAYQ